MSNSKTNPIQALLQSAYEEGTLSAESLQTLSIHDIGSQIEAGLGVSVDQVQASEVVLVTMMIDDSGSIRFSGNTQVVRDGHNEVLKALMASKQNHSMLAHTCYLNGHILFPYIPLAVADDLQLKQTGKVTYVPNLELVMMDSCNYDPHLGTPLYDQTAVLLGRVLAKYQEFTESGVAARTVTLIITDGADEGSTHAAAKDVRTLVEDLLGEHHIVAAMGIDNRQTDFRRVFREMGIRDEWILTPANTNSEIRKAFQMFSQSAAQAGRTAAYFSQVAAGGFSIC